MHEAGQQRVKYDPERRAEQPSTVPEKETKTEFSIQGINDWPLLSCVGRADTREYKLARRR